MPRTRTLTLMFTDIVGSTEMLAAMTARQAERARSEHLAAVSEQVTRQGGRVVKTLGDGVMAAFDSAAAAVEAATGAQSRSRIPIRVGISSGEVSERDADCFGPAVVEASRLCAAAVSGQILIADRTRMLLIDRDALSAAGELMLRGLPEPTRAWEAAWVADHQPPVRAVLADDSVLLREGVARLLEAAGIEVVAQADDARTLLALTAQHAPDIAIVDLRMPPTFTTEGLDAAERIRAEHPGTSVLLLSQEVEPRYATRLRATGGGVGYLLKERVTDVHEFTEATRRIAAGGVVFDPTLS